MGVSRQTISSLENGRYNPSILLAHKIAKFFGMTIEEVFVFEENEYEEIAEAIKENTKSGDVILFKASRAMALEKVIELLK